MLVVSCSNSVVSVWKRDKDFDWSCVNQITSKSNPKTFPTALKSLPSPVVMPQPLLITKTSAQEAKRNESPRQDPPRPPKASPPVVDQPSAFGGFMMPSTKLTY